MLAPVWAQKISLSINESPPFCFTVSGRYGSENEPIIHSAHAYVLTRTLGTRLVFVLWASHYGNRGRFHHTRPTSQRPVGFPRKKGTTFSDQTGPTKRNGSYHFLFIFRIPYISKIYWRVGQWTGLSKWNGKFRSNRSKWTTSRGGPEYSGRNIYIHTLYLTTVETSVIS